jgi:hypothetical protein
MNGGTRKMEDGSLTNLFAKNPNSHLPFPIISQAVYKEQIPVQTP